MKLSALLLIAIHYVYSYKIISRNFIANIDGATNEGSIIETVQYDFENLSIPIALEKYPPKIQGEIKNVSVTANPQSAILGWSLQRKDNDNIILVNVSKLQDLPVTLNFTYYTIGLMNPANQSVNMLVSNYDSQTDLQSKVEVILDNIHTLLTPQNVFLDKNYEFGYFYDNVHDLSYLVKVDKNVVTTIQPEIAIAKRENRLKGNNLEEKEKPKHYKISFVESLKKGQMSNISFRVNTEKPRGSGSRPPAPSSHSSSPSYHPSIRPLPPSHSNSPMTRPPPPPTQSSGPMTRPPPPAEYNKNPSSAGAVPNGGATNNNNLGNNKQYTNNDNIQNTNKNKRSSSNNTVWEAIIAFLYVACLIFLCYECCTYCCGSGEAHKAGGEGEYVYVCNQ